MHCIKFLKNLGRAQTLVLLPLQALEDCRLSFQLEQLSQTTSSVRVLIGYQLGKRWAGHLQRQEGYIALDLLGNLRVSILIADKAQSRKAAYCSR